jgi:peptidoglycan hydrolase-like protein with peptidoglycan-binding domain
MVLLLCALTLCGGSTIGKVTAPAASGSTKHISADKRVRHKRASRRRSWKSRGQKAIDNQRAREIQLALIRESYFRGEPTGIWDARTKLAMQRYQADRGWQTKVVPDSRALIDLGLGPKHEDIINPETAMTPETMAATPITRAAPSAPQH